MFATILTVGGIVSLVLPLWLMVVGKIRMGGFFLLAIVLVVLTIVFAQPFKSSEQLQAEREARISKLRSERNASLEKAQDAIQRNDSNAAEAYTSDAEKSDARLKDLEHGN